MEISKELLSEVYAFEVRDFVKLGTDDVTYEVRFNGLKNGLKYNIINIYELQHLCKEWAFTQGYELRNGRDIDVKEELCYFCEYKQERQLDYANGDYFLATTEPESVTKACQWILERLNEKQQ